MFDRVALQKSLCSITICGMHEASTVAQLRVSCALRSLFVLLCPMLRDYRELAIIFYCYRRASPCPDIRVTDYK